MSVTLRNAHEGDAATVAAICNAITQELYGEGDVTAAEVRSWFAMPDLELLVAERDGRVLGYMDVRRDDDGARFAIDLRIPPDSRGLGVGERLLAAAEDGARGRAKRDAILRGFTSERDREVATAYERAGYRIVRHSFHMHIELPDEPAPPEWPDGITVRTYEHPRDEGAVYECVQESFADHWDFRPQPIERWRTFSIEREWFDPDLWWLAEGGGELAGVCLNAWHFSGDRTFGWIGTLGVRRPWRRRGLGLALLRHSFVDFKARDATRVGLGVDAENTTGAVRLYERAGMSVARRNDTFEKRL